MEAMVVVNCDQDYKPDLNPSPRQPTEAEPDTPTPAMSTTTDTANENTTTRKRSVKAAVDASISEVWYLKPIKLAGRRARVITQNFNGSVSVAYRTAATPTLVTECLSPIPQAMFIYSDL
jgi:hypothetical protein